MYSGKMYSTRHVSVVVGGTTVLDYLKRDKNAIR